jgi:hypothetical protein
MTFLNGITHLTNWLGNVIMPTIAGLFFALAVIRYARGYPHQYIAWAGLMCLMVSGLLRGLEMFAAQSAWNNPDTIWITLRGLVNWTCNVFMPVYAVLQIVQGVLAHGGVGHRLYQGMPWIRHSCGGWLGTGSIWNVAPRGVFCPFIGHQQEPRSARPIFHFATRSG